MSVVAEFANGGLSAEVHKDDGTGDLTTVEFSGVLAHNGTVKFTDGAWEFLARSTQGASVDIPAGHSAASANLTMEFHAAD